MDVGALESQLLDERREALAKQKDGEYDLGNEFGLYCFCGISEYMSIRLFLPNLILLGITSRDGGYEHAAANVAAST